MSEYLSSERPLQLAKSSLCQPWEVFESDWDYRYCVGDVVRKVSRQ